MIALPWWGWGLAGIAWLTGSFAFGVLVGHVIAAGDDGDDDAEMRRYEALRHVFGATR